MKLLFFDMEFADGRVPGSIYSFGYTVTDEEFHTLTPPTDLLINPESTWNEYVEQKILAYPKAEVEAAPNFASRYEEIRRIFEEVDLAVGFSVNNDLRALRKDCERYGLPVWSTEVLDTERLCRLMEEHKDAHGLAGYVRAWCGEEPDHQHRSDGDALATMMLLRAVCRVKHVDPEMIRIAYPECRSNCRPDGKERTKKKPARHGQSRRKRGGSRKKTQPKETPAADKK